jgi:6-phosphogluconolactonase (cycloisomerase 2 family)
MKYLKFPGLFLFLLVIFFAGCEKNSDIPTNADTQTNTTSLNKLNGHYYGNVSAVVTESNSASGNEVVVYSRSNNGSLSFQGSYPTGGTGNGGSLHSQGAVTISGRYIFAVNAGSNEVSVLKFQGNNLKLVDKKSSGGTLPVSLTVHDDYLYVLNAGGDGNITGFKINDEKDGIITQIPNSTRPLSGSGTAPAQIEFSPNGRVLVVTEKATNIIDTYIVNRRGIASGPNSQPSTGQTPYGFEFDRRGRLIVSDAVGGTAGAGAMTSYRVGYGGLNLVSGPVADNQTAPCWVVVTKNGRYTYTTNTGTANISGYRIHHNGRITLFDDGGNTASTGDGSTPIDMALDHSSRYLYALGAGTHTISVFKINNYNGSLISVQTVSGLPDHSAGLAAN